MDKQRRRNKRKRKVIIRVRYDTIRNTNGRRDEGEGDGRWEVAVIANLRGKWVRKAAPKSLLDDAAGAEIKSSEWMGFLEFVMIASGSGDRSRGRLVRMHLRYQCHRWKTIRYAVWMLCGALKTGFLNIRAGEPWWKVRSRSRRCSRGFAGAYDERRSRIPGRYTSMEDKLSKRPLGSRSQDRPASPFVTWPARIG